MKEHAEMGAEYHALMQRVEKLPWGARVAADVRVMDRGYSRKLRAAIVGHLKGEVTVHAFRHAVSDYVAAVNSIVDEVEKEDLAA